jgi:hypothetical protein
MIRKFKRNVLALAINILDRLLTLSIQKPNLIE